MIKIAAATSFQRPLNSFLIRSYISSRPLYLLIAYVYFQTTGVTAIPLMQVTSWCCPVVDLLKTS